MKTKFIVLLEVIKDQNKSWPVSTPLKADFQVWKKFLAAITFNKSIVSHTLIQAKHLRKDITSNSRIQLYEVPYKELVENLVKFSSRSSFILLLLDSKVVFVVDSSFYPTKSHLILAA